MSRARPRDQDQPDLPAEVAPDSVESDRSAAEKAAAVAAEKEKTGAETVV